MLDQSLHREEREQIWRVGIQTRELELKMLTEVLIRPSLNNRDVCQ